MFRRDLNQPARTRCICLLASGVALLLAARHTAAQPICPIPPQEIPWCEQLQTSQCFTNDPNTTTCEPRLVFNIPQQPPIIELCECFDDQGCGPIKINPSPIPGEWIYSCPGNCPDPQQPCEVFINGNPTGLGSISSFQVPTGAQVTCDCGPPVVDVCPLTSDLLCANLQTTQCLTTAPGTRCAPTKLTIVGQNPTQVAADECACADGQDCGPIHVDVVASGYIVSCVGACPPGSTGVCEIFANGQPTGMQSAAAGQFPTGVTLTCDCPSDVPEVCPLATDFCANLQFTDCLTTDPTSGTCWPRAVTGGATPQVLACDCFENECGPVEILPAAQGFIYNCLGPCPNPNQPCEVFFDDGTGPVPTGQMSVLSINVPAGVTVTCDCAEEVPEACCLPDGTCVDLLPADCLQQGGTPQGAGTACNGVVEACCLPDDSCVMVERLCCDDLGGTFMPGDVCGGAVEACCLPNDQCIMADPLCCTAQGGNPQGAGSQCTTFEACCLPDGTCAMMDPLCCDDAGGTAQGAGSFCTQVEACCFADGTCKELDPLCCSDQGGTPQGAGTTCADVQCGNIDEVVFEFSLDIGSDTELSDPNVDGDEGADPGDVYLWHSAPYRPPLQPCGRDGFKDDLFIFGFDPFPNPPDCAVPPATAVPVGSGIDPADGYPTYFDLDGHDQTDFDLRQYVPPTAPLDLPIPQGQIGSMTCVHPPQFLLMSMDDDRAPGWPSGDVPTTSASASGAIYGTTAGINEIIGKTLAVGPVLPLPVTLNWRAFREAELHSDMAPNPDAGDKDDDDVDSLDAVRNPEFCPYWYFTADHEAHRLLDPGGVYLAVGGGAPVKVIDEAIHLGIPESTDLDALEFTWLEFQIPGGPAGPALALLYSVDQDDPLTPLVDESGGLNPRQIYASFLTGSSVPLLANTDLPPDDIDALTIWIKELLPTCKDSDVNCDGFTDGNDIAGVLNAANFQQVVPACDRTDVNGSGTVDGNDIAVIVNILNFQTSTGPCECYTATPGTPGCPP